MGRAAVAPNDRRPWPPPMDGKRLASEWAAPRQERPLVGLGSFLRPLFCWLFSALLTKPHGLREFRTRLGIVGRHHRVVRCEIPKCSIFLRGHVVTGTQVALERFVFLTVKKRNKVIRGDRLFDRHRWFTPRRLRRLRLADVVQCCMNCTYKRRNIA